MSKRFEAADDRHSQIRALFRVIGPLLFGIGVVLIAIGMISFFSAFGSFGPPQYFWCFFAGVPFVGLGQMVTRFAYMGPVLRYIARETIPVASDTFNEMAEGTCGGVETLAHAVGRGLSSGIESMQGTVPTANANGSTCEACGSNNQPDARFCNQCGGKLT